MKTGASAEKQSGLEGFSFGRRGLSPQPPTSRIMRGRSPGLSVLVYLGYNLFGANSALFVQCQAQSGPAHR